MKPTSLLTALLIIALTYYSDAAGRAASKATILEGLDGKKVLWTQFRGKVTLVSVFEPG